MSKEVILRLRDDFDGTILDDGVGENITFSFRGVEYEIDLTHENIAEFETTMAKWIKAARPIKPVKTTKKAPSTRKGIRDWALENGYEMSGNGRASKEVVAAYDEHMAKRNA